MEIGDTAGLETCATFANNGAQIATSDSVDFANNSSQFDGPYSSQLPAACKTLYWLARLGDEAGQPLLLDLIDKGDIREDMKAKEALALFRKYVPQPDGKRHRWPLNRRLAQIDDFVSEIEEEGAPDERELVASKFSQFSERLAAAARAALIQTTDEH